MVPIVALLLEFAVLALIKVGGTDTISNILASLLITAYSFVLFYYFNHNRRLKRFSHSLVLAYMLRLLILFIDLFAYPTIALPNGHGDEEMFFGNAVSYALYGINRRGLYPQVIGTLMRIVGLNRLFVQYVSLLSSIVALVFLAYTLSETQIEEVIQKKTFRIVCLLPNYAILSSLLMREAVVYMFLSISVYYFVKWVRKKREVFFYMAALTVMPAAAFHSGTIAVLVGYLVIRLFYDNKKETVSIRLTNVVLSLALAFIAVYIIGRTGNTFTNKFGNVESLEDIANVRDTAGSSYAQYVGNSNNPLSFIIFTPLRLFFFLFSPLPGMWRGIGDIIAFFFSSMYYVVSIWNVVKYLRTHQEKNRMLIIALFIVALAAVFVFAWGTSNAGTATRHRDKMLLIFAVLLALSRDGLKFDSDRFHYYRKRRV